MTRLLFRNIKHAAVVGAATFFSAILIIFGSGIFFNKVTSLFLYFIFLIAIILVGIIFDIIGVAAAAATEPPLCARAAKKQAGALQAINLVRNADRVASFSNDVIGDIAGTVSGAIGASIIFRLVLLEPGLNTFVYGAVMTGAVAALTVSGKAFGKSYAINEANEIIFFVGKLIYIVEKKFGFKLTGKINRREKRR
ncbi:MAG: hypothetical protein KGZ96_06840 [Clostridia bacterium]|nr:hypothetical protein [Clostridia bacterium]